MKLHIIAQSYCVIFIIEAYQIDSVQTLFIPVGNSREICAVGLMSHLLLVLMLVELLASCNFCLCSVNIVITWDQHCPKETWFYVEYDVRGLKASGHDLTSAFLNAESLKMSYISFGQKG